MISTAGDLTKHNGPGPHESGSPQSVHGGGSTAGLKVDKRPKRIPKPAESAPEVSKVVTFEKAGDAHVWGAAQSSMSVENLTPEEKDVLNKYKRSSKYYGHLNHFLRHGDFRPESPDFYTEPSAFENHEQAIQFSKTMDAAFEKSTVPTDVVVYRALSSESIPKKTKTFSDAGYGSTSLSADNGMRFTAYVRDNGQTPAIMKIKVPKGNKGIYLEGLWDNGEAEILLPRNTKYRITKDYTGEKGIRIIEAEVIE